MKLNDWCFCPYCNGQRQILELARNGEGYIPVPCDYCFATGAVLSFSGGK